MAQKIQTLYIDDLDGSQTDGTVRFGLDGTEYEIDLNAEHAQQLRDALARYVSVKETNKSDVKVANLHTVSIWYPHRLLSVLSS